MRCVSGLRTLVMRTSPSTCRLLTLVGLVVSQGGFSAEGKTVLNNQAPRVHVIPAVLLFGLYSNKQTNKQTNQVEASTFTNVMINFECNTPYLPSWPHDLDWGVCPQPQAPSRYNKRSIKLCRPVPPSSSLIVSFLERGARLLLWYVFKFWLDAFNKEMHAVFEVHAGQVELDQSLIYVCMGACLYTVWTWSVPQLFEG